MLFYTRCFLVFPLTKTAKEFFYFKKDIFFFKFSFHLYRVTSLSCTHALAHLHPPPFCFVCLRACWLLAGPERSDSRLFFKGRLAPTDAPKRCGVELLCHGGPSRRDDLLCERPQRRYQLVRRRNAILFPSLSFAFLPRSHMPKSLLSEPAVLR